MALSNMQSNIFDRPKQAAAVQFEGSMPVSLAAILIILVLAAEPAIPAVNGAGVVGHGAIVLD
jgi:hypothetical protein